MTWEIHSVTTGLGAHKAAWDDLNRRLTGDNPYYSSRFVEPLVSHFSTGKEKLCLHRNEDGIDGMLIVEAAGKGKWSTFLPSQAQLAPVMLQRPEVLRALLPKLSRGALGLDCLCQDPQISPLYAGGAPLPVIEQRHALTISIAVGPSFDDYWNERPRKLKQNVDRRLRRAREDWKGVHLRTITDPRALEDALERYGDLESRGWKGEAGTAIHASNVQGKFYRQVLQLFAAEHKAFAYELYFGDLLVASRLAIGSDDMLVMLKTTYDEAQSRLSPGRLLLFLVLQAEFEARRFKSIEFYTNANRDLIDWSTDQRWINHVLLLRNFPVRYLYKLARRSPAE